MWPIRVRVDGRPLLVVVPNVGMSIDGDRVFMDIKALEWLALYALLWPGPIRCISRASDPSAIGYGQWHFSKDLPFEPVMVARKADAAAIMHHAYDAALILAGADNHLDLGLVGASGNIPVVLTIEYTLRTRLDILRLSGAPISHKIKTALWLIYTERKRVLALAHAAGLQANGTPAYHTYGPNNSASILYFDTRLRTSDFIGAEGASRKSASLATGNPLRLAFSGRLEKMKGAEDLIKVMTALRRRSKIQCYLDIYGKGSLQDRMLKQIAKAGLSNWVKLNDPVDFYEELVPILKSRVDLFVCCHPQGDPSCTYLETLGCGVPIVGYANQAFKGILSLGLCGVSVPVGDVEAMASAIERLDEDRSLLATLTGGAVEIASTRLFELMFADRVAHLRTLAPVRQGN